MIKELHDVPGPRGLPILGNLLQIKMAKFHSHIRQWADEFGPLYKFRLANKNYLVFSGSDAVTQMMRNRPGDFRRWNAIESVFNEIAHTGLFTAEGSEWTRQRRLTAPAFIPANLKQFFPTLRLVTERFLARLEGLAQSDAEFEATREFMRFTVDVTTLLSMTYDINTLQKDKDPIQDHLNIFFKIFGRRVLAPVPYWRIFKLPSDRALDRGLRELTKLVGGIVSETRAQIAANPPLQEKPANLLQGLLTACDEDGQPLTEKEIFGNILTILLGGEDTTANTLAWMAYYMTQHPEVQKRMQAEADLALGGRRGPETFEDTERLSYIEAVAMEAMRLKPVGPFLFLEPTRDLEIDGLAVSRGTQIIALTTYQGFQKQNFTEPEKFYPERWLSEERPADWNHNFRLIFPFGGGPRACPGRNLSLLEIKVVMAMLCRNFAITKVGSEPVEERYHFVVVPRNFHVRLKAR